MTSKQSKTTRTFATTIFGKQQQQSFKFAAIIDNFNSVACQLPFGDRFSIDEQIIPMQTEKSSQKLCQYNPKKPKKWGYKVFALTSTEGLIHKVEFYIKAKKENSSRVEVAGSVVLRLIDVLREGKKLKLFFDNWFTSSNLIEELNTRGFRSLSTYRSNRFGGLTFSNEIEKWIRGTIQVKTASMPGNDNDIVAIQWGRQ